MKTRVKVIGADSTNELESKINSFLEGGNYSSIVDIKYQSTSNNDYYFNSAIVIYLSN